MVWLWLAIFAPRAEAQRVRIAERWDAQLPEGAFSRWPDQPYTVVYGGDHRRLVTLVETGHSGRVTAARLPAPLAGDECAALDEEATEDGWLWLRCAVTHEGASLHALVRHDDGGWLLAHVSSDAPMVWALVRSLRPRVPDCGERCGLGLERWLAIRAEPGYRLARVVEVGMDVHASVVEVAPVGERCVQITSSRFHWRPPSPKERKVERKVRLHGVPIPAYAADGALALDYSVGGSDVMERLSIHGCTPAALARAVRMVEAATPGPGWTSAHDGLYGRRVRAPKRGDRRVSAGAAPRILAAAIVALGLAALFARSRRRRRRRSTGHR